MAMNNAADRQTDLPGRSQTVRWRWGLVAVIVAAVIAAAVIKNHWVWPETDVQRRSLSMPTVSEHQESDAQPLATIAAESQEPERFAILRQRMVDLQLANRDICDERVLDVMRRVPRHRFVPESQRESAYADWPLQIGAGQTISQPYIVGLMTQLAQPRPDSRALDVGTGSGYQAAVLAELCREVYSIEIVESLATEARSRLTELEYHNVQVRHGDGYRGWPEHAPFDVIILAAAPPHVPEPLVEQLAVGGRLVLPVGERSQELVVVEKQPDGSTRQWTEVPVRFVPMTGEAQQ
jgi:protein-L-isoaspartate(D-aspartate) O-methyltransferase